MLSFLFSVKPYVTYLVVPLGPEVLGDLVGLFHQKRGVQGGHEIQVYQVYQARLHRQRIKYQLKVLAWCHFVLKQSHNLKSTFESWSSISSKPS